MGEQLIHYGLPALFVISFLASTLVPLGSEWLLVALVVDGTSLQTVVLVATVGNYLGACLMYGIGFLGLGYVTEKLLRINKQKQAKALQLFNRYGTWALLFTWLPVVGDPLCLISGGSRFHFLPFSLLVFTGKFLRYSAVAGAAAALTS